MLFKKNLKYFHFSRQRHGLARGDVDANECN